MRPIILLYDPEVDLGAWHLASGRSVSDWLDSVFDESNDDVRREAVQAIQSALLEGESKAAAADGWAVVAITDVADLAAVRRDYPGVPTNAEVLNSPDWKGMFSWQDRVQSELDVDTVLRNAGIAAANRG